MMSNNSWASHGEFVVLLITLIGGFYLLDGKIERQSIRTDQLYSMYVEAQNETKKAQETYYRLYIDTQKEIHRK